MARPGIILYGYDPSDEVRFGQFRPVMTLKTVAVYVEEMKDRGHNKVYIRVTVYVERDSQKRIVIGKNGTVLKEVGNLARQEIENLLGSSVYLDIWVKVKRDWRNKSGALSELGYKNE